MAATILKEICLLGTILLLVACAPTQTEVSPLPKDAAGMYNLGMRYGTVAEQDNNRPDYQRSFFWLQKSAGEGYLPALHALGWSYLKGRGVDQDLDRACRHFRRAAEAGYAESQYMLGLMYAQGWGVDQDSARSLHWIRQAAAQDHAEAARIVNRLAPSDRTKD